MPTLEEELTKRELQDQIHGVSGFFGPISITEDKNYYKVEIHYHDKELVKYINGWQWNASERKWYFERKDDTFNELKKFEKYASKFEITKPKPKLEIDQTKDVSDENSLIDLLEEDSYEIDNDQTENDTSFNSRITNIEKQIEILNSNIIDKILPNLSEIQVKSEIKSTKENKKDETLNKKDISYDDVIQDIISYFPNDEYNKAFEKYNFTIKQPADMVQNILNLIQCELKELVSQEDYEKECKRVGEIRYVKNNQKAQDYKLSLKDLNHFVRRKRYLHYDTNEPDAFKLIDAANNLRNRILKTDNKEGLNLFLKTVYTLNFVLLTRIAWGRITVREKT